MNEPTQIQDSDARKIATYEVPISTVKLMWLRYTGMTDAIGPVWIDFLEGFKVGWLLSRNLDPDYHRVVLVNK